MSLDNQTQSTQSTELPSTTTAEAATAPIKVSLPPLTLEERADLRRRVLQGQKLSIEDSRRVFETLRAQQGAAVITGEESKAKKKGKASKGISDAELSQDLDKALGL